MDTLPSLIHTLSHTHIHRSPPPPPPTHTHTQTPVLTHARAHTPTCIHYADVCMHTWTRACTRTHARTHTLYRCMYARTHARRHSHTHVIKMYVCTHWTRRLKRMYKGGEDYDLHIVANLSCNIFIIKKVVYLSGMATLMVKKVLQTRIS